MVQPDGRTHVVELDAPVIVIKCGLPETFFISENQGHKNQGKAHPKAPL